MGNINFDFDDGAHALRAALTAARIELLSLRGTLEVAIPHMDSQFLKKAFCEQLARIDRLVKETEKLV